MQHVQISLMPAGSLGHFTGLLRWLNMCLVPNIGLFSLRRFPLAVLEAVLGSSKCPLGLSAGRWSSGFTEAKVPHEMVSGLPVPKPLLGRVALL